MKLLKLTPVVLALAGCTTSSNIETAKAEFDATCEEVRLTRDDLVAAGYQFTPDVKTALDEAISLCTNPPTDMKSAVRKLTVRLLILSQAK